MQIAPAWAHMLTSLYHECVLCNYPSVIVTLAHKLFKLAHGFSAWCIKVPSIAIIRKENPVVLLILLQKGSFNISLVQFKKRTNFNMHDKKTKKNHKVILHFILIFLQLKVRNCMLFT